MSGSLIISAVGFGIVTASILSIAAVGFTMQFGVTNILNLSYGEVMTACAFVAYTCNHRGMSVWAALLVASAFGAVVSVVLNRLLFTPFVRRGTELFGMVIVTLATGLIIQNVALAIYGPNFFSYRFGTGSSYHVSAMVFTRTQLEIIAVAVAVMASVHVLLRHTKLGKAMRAISSNPALARNSGVPTERVIDLAWLISGALCGIAGVVLVMNTSSFESTTGSGFLVIIVAAAMLGGVGHPYGAMLGALMLGIATELASAVFSPVYSDVIALLLLVVVLLFRPQGIFADVAEQKRAVA